MTLADVTPSLLAQVGQALYGPQWQSALARDLGVSDRTMRRWAAASADVPARIGAELLVLVQQRGDALAVLARRLQAGRE